MQIRRIDLSKFKIFQTILRNQSTLTPIFSWAVYFTNLKWRHWFDRCVLPDDLSINSERLFVLNKGN